MTEAAEDRRRPVLAVSTLLNAAAARLLTVVDVILRAILQTAQSGQRGQWRRWSGYTEALQCVSGACARRPLAGHVNGCVRRTGAAVGDVRRRRGVGQHGVIGDDRVRRGGGGA